MKGYSKELLITELRKSDYSRIENSSYTNKLMYKIASKTLKVLNKICSSVTFGNSRKYDNIVSNESKDLIKQRGKLLPEEGGM